MYFCSQVTSMLNQMAFHLNQLKTATKIKLLTFPLSLGFGIQSIEEEVFSDFANKLTDIETWDLVQICSYISKQGSGVRFCCFQASDWSVVTFLALSLVETANSNTSSSGIGPSILSDQSLNCILWTLGSLPEPHFFDAGTDPRP